jgi:hypothetical protein
LNQSININPIVEEKKSNNGTLWFIIILLITAVVIYYYYNQNKTISSDNAISIDTVKVVSSTLSDFEIFDLQAIQNFKPTDEQKNIAQNLLDDAILAMKNQNFKAILPQKMK